MSSKQDVVLFSIDKDAGFSGFSEDEIHASEKKLQSVVTVAKGKNVKTKVSNEKKRYFVSF